MTRYLSMLSLITACGLAAACSSSRNPGFDAGGTIDGGGMVDAFRPDAPVDAFHRDAPVDAFRPDAGECSDLPIGPSRPVPWECSPCRLPGPGGITSGLCTSDAECVDGVNGRCGFSRIGGECSYDACFSDADCAPDEACSCDGSRGGGNACIDALCHIDADCGAYDCSPSLGSCGHYFPPVGLYCHTAADTCYGDDECVGGYCAYNPELGRWACSNAECAG